MQNILFEFVFIGHNAVFKNQIQINNSYKEITNEYSKECEVNSKSILLVGVNVNIFCKFVILLSYLTFSSQGT